MSDTTATVTRAEIEALTVRLKAEYANYVILHAHTGPQDVVQFFLDDTIGYDERTATVLEAALRGTQFWRADQVAEVLLTTHASLQSLDTWVDDFIEEHIKIIPVGFSKDSDIQLVNTGTFFRAEGTAAEVLGSPDPDDTEEEREDADVLESNPFVGLDPETPLTAKEAAALLGRSYGYMKDHGGELGGTKSPKGTWQFWPARLEAIYETHKGPQG